MVRVKAGGGASVWLMSDSRCGAEIITKLAGVLERGQSRGSIWPDTETILHSVTKKRSPPEITGNGYIHSPIGPDAGNCRKYLHTVHTCS